MTAPVRAALYLRVSTARQAEHDVSIPDQKRQGEAYCVSRGHELVETYIEPGASATNDRRPEFQRMIEAGAEKPAPFASLPAISRIGCFSQNGLRRCWHPSSIAGKSEPTADANISPS